MFWEYVTFVIVLLFGLFNIIWPGDMAEIAWAVRHRIDDEGRKSIEKGFRFFGIIIIIGCIIWLTTQLNM